MVCELPQADLTSVGGWVAGGQPEGEELQATVLPHEACPARVGLGETQPRRGSYGPWALMTAPAIPGQAGPTQKGRKRKRARVGPGGGAGWAGDQSRIVSWSPWLISSPAASPGRRGAPGAGGSHLGPPCPLLPVSPARLPGPPRGLLAPIGGRLGSVGGGLAPLLPPRDRRQIAPRSPGLFPRLYSLDENAALGDGGED